LEPEVPVGVLPVVGRLVEAEMGRATLLWFLSVPIPVTVLLWLTFRR